jgi:hypothetical protein
MSNFFTKQLEDASKGSVFFSAIRKARRIEIERKKKEARWQDYKIYPSSLKSMTQCPKEFIKSLEKAGTIEDLQAVYRVKRGSAVHREFQDSLLLSDKLYQKPKYIEDERIRAKLEANWPEVPYHSKITNHSGSADGMIKFKNRPAVIELKTTSVDDYKWEALDKPSDAHIFQVMDYMYHFNEMEYFDIKIEESFLCYLQLRYDPGEQDAEKEFTVYYDEHKEKYLSYIHEETRQLRAYIDKVELKCNHEFCFRHRERK